MKKLLIGLLALGSISSFAQHRRVIYNASTANNLVEEIGAIAVKAIEALKNDNRINGCYYVAQLALVTSNISIADDFKIPYGPVFREDIDALHAEMSRWGEEGGFCSDYMERMSAVNIATHIPPYAKAFLPTNSFIYRF